MLIRSLKDVSIEEVVKCMVEAFKNYFFPMTDNVEYWENRFQRAGVDYNYSYGVFDGDRLIAFIIHAIDHLEGVLTAYNTGTGVIEDYRGQKWVDQMYAYAIPRLQEKGIQEVTLEVIDINYPAVSVYERIGFVKERSLFGFQGEIAVKDASKVEISERPLSFINGRISSMYSWDFRSSVVVKGTDTYQLYTVSHNDEYCGYFVWSPTNGLIAQIESERKDYAPILQAIGGFKKNIRINNVVESRLELREALEKAGLRNHVVQYEMKMDI